MDFSDGRIDVVRLGVNGFGGSETCRRYSDARINSIFSSWLASRVLHEKIEECWSPEMRRKRMDASCGPRLQSAAFDSLLVQRQWRSRVSLHIPEKSRFNHRVAPCGSAEPQQWSTRRLGSAISSTLSPQRTTDNVSSRHAYIAHRLTPVEP